MIKISICICTRRRQEGLKKLLESLSKIETSSDLDVQLIIVENDIKNNSEEVINGFLNASKLCIRYYLEPKQGLAYARNKSVKEAYGSDFCCFVDDDQIVAPDWLLELLKCQSEFNADGVGGLTPPVFSKTLDVPNYIKKFHMPVTYPYGTILKEAYTGCLLLRKRYLDKIEGPFDIRFNVTGGEDIYLTYLITQMGGIIRFNPNAIAYEVISPNRTTIKYIIKRSYRNSNTSYYVKSLAKINFSKANNIPILISRLCLGVVYLIPYLIWGKSERLKGLILLANSIGGFSFVLGNRNRFYK